MSCNSSGGGPFIKRAHRPPQMESSLPLALGREAGYLRRAVTVAMALVALAAPIFGAHVFSVGLTHVSTAAAYRMASEAWISHKYGTAAKLFGLALNMTWRGGVSSQLASVHLERTRRLRDAGNLEGALRECSQAVQALGFYDDEGATSYLCFQIETQMKQASPHR